MKILKILALLIITMAIIFRSSNCVKADTLVSKFQTKNSTVELYKRNNSDGSVTMTTKSKSTNAQTGKVTETIMIETRKNGKTLSLDIKKYIDGQLDASFSNKKDDVVPSSNKYAKTNNQNLQPVEQINQGTNRYQRSDSQNQTPTNNYNYQQPASNLQQLNTSNRYARTYQQVDNTLKYKTEVNTNPSSQENANKTPEELFRPSGSEMLNGVSPQWNYFYSGGNRIIECGDKSYRHIKSVDAINDEHLEFYFIKNDFLVVFNREKEAVKDSILFKNAKIDNRYFNIFFTFLNEKKYNWHDFVNKTYYTFPGEIIEGNNSNETIRGVRGGSTFVYNLNGGFDTYTDQDTYKVSYDYEERDLGDPINNTIKLGKGISYDNIAIRGFGVDILDSNKNKTGQIYFDNSIRFVKFEDGYPFIDKPIFDLRQMLSSETLVSNPAIGNNYQQEYTIPNNYSFISLYGAKTIRTQNAPIIAYSLDTSTCLNSDDTIISEGKKVSLFMYSDMTLLYSVDPHDWVQGKYRNPNNIKYDCFYSQIPNTNDLLIVLPSMGDRKITVKDFFDPQFSIRLNIVFKIIGGIKVVVDHEKEDILNIINNQNNSNQ